MHNHFLEFRASSERRESQQLLVVVEERHRQVEFGARQLCCLRPRRRRIRRPRRLTQLSKNYSSDRHIPPSNSPALGPIPACLAGKIRQSD